MAVMELYSNNTIPDNLSFQTVNTQQILIVSGSAYYAGTDGAATVAVSVDGKAVGTLKAFQNGGPRHLAFQTRLFPMLLDAGTHKVQFKLGPATVSDANDQFNVVLIDM